MTLAVKAGLVPEDAEQLQYHVHSHLDVFVDGRTSSCPAGLGIDITNPGVHTFVAERREVVRRDRGAVRQAVHLAAAHARHQRRAAHRVGDAQGQHPRSAVRRVERAAHLDVLRERLRTREAGGVLRRTEPSSPAIPTTIALSNLKEIAIVVGTPPAQIPNSFDQALI